MQLPDFLEPYRLQGEQYLKKQSIQEITFSGSTYQIALSDLASKETVWVFLQLDDDHVKDIFCNGPCCAELHHCEHMAAACFIAFLNRREPLHKQFDHSFWKALFFECSKMNGVQAPLISSQEIRTPVGDLLFKYKGKLPGFGKESKIETEETSIKFSNIQDEELELWKSGRPSEAFQFELSQFSDLAKALMLRQNRGEKYTIELKSKPKALPSELAISFSDLEISLKISPELLLAIIPTLDTVTCNLQFFTKENTPIQSVAFNAKKGEFKIERAPFKLPVKATTIGPYLFTPDEGFYSKKQTPAASSPPNLLHHHLDLLRKELKEYSFTEERQELQYTVSISQNATLTIKSYLFQPGDVTHLFQDWVYLDKKKAFLAIETPRMSAIETKVPLRELSSFILQHRTFLSSFPGFQVHLAKIHEDINFVIDKLGRLSFVAHTKSGALKKQEIDCGEWFYEANDGFYPKASYQEEEPLQEMAPIPEHHVADFIRRNSARLETLPHFFAKNASCPIKAIGLTIILQKKNCIDISPNYTWTNPDDARGARFYDEFVYVEKKGFYRLPHELRPLHILKEIRASDTAQWNLFFTELRDKFKQEYACKIDPRLEAAEDMKLFAESITSANEKEESEWAMELSFISENAKVKLADLIQAIRQGIRFLPTEVGTIDLLEHRFRWLHARAKQAPAKQKSGFRLTSADLLKIDAYEPLHFSKEGHQNAILERLISMQPGSPADCSKLQCDLRSYQRNGVEWLWFLYQNGLSGILADDMGVGKTHQAMGLMAAISAEKKKATILIVCPTSLIYHWQDKLQRFLPHLRVKAYIGLQRSLDDFADNYDVLLVSYGIFRNEAMLFKKFFFDAAFFDELQIAKNHVSQIYNALLITRAHTKIGLTGTPIENQLRELKALFDLVLPGYMPGDTEFREFFVRPIEKLEGDYEARRKLLARYVKPFVLRRKKQDVLPELPEKAEDFAFAELIGEQKTLYRQVAQREAQPLLQLLSSTQEPIPYMHIFALISSLKQICNHPAAYLKDLENYERYESGKWDAFVELLEEAAESEQKVVVFSQYLSMLDIIASHLTKNGIKFAEIRGQTRSRGEEVARFHDDPECRVFLGSLSAAGLGIDLTPASIVIHYDRWWNAARENQATDRVHRLGQTRGVQVYKLITKNSIEEKIDALITKKQSLLDELVTPDDHLLLKRINRSEIISLLQDLSQE